jgi:hypothetical protein
MSHIYIAGNVAFTFMKLRSLLKTNSFILSSIGQPEIGSLKIKVKQKIINIGVDSMWLSQEGQD